MSEKQLWKQLAWVKEPLTEEENHVLTKSFLVMMSSCVLFGFIPILLGILTHLPIVSWLGVGSFFFGCIWTVMIVIPQFLRVTKQVRKRVQEKESLLKGGKHLKP